MVTEVGEGLFMKPGRSGEQDAEVEGHRDSERSW